MAQETNIKAIELNDTGAKLITNFGDAIAKQRMQNAQLEQEKVKMYMDLQKDGQNKMFQIANDIPVRAHSLITNPSLRDEAIGAMQKYYAENQGKIDPTAMTIGIGKQLQTFTDLGNKHSAVNAQVETFTKGLGPDQSNFSTNRLIEDVNKLALYKEVDGKLVAKPAEEIDVNKDYVTELLNGPEGWKYWNGSAGFESLQKEIKEGAKVKEKAKVVDQNGLVRTLEGSTVEYNANFQRVNPKTGKVELRTGDDGRIEDKAYQQIIVDPKINASFSQMAQKFIDDYNNTSAKDKLEFIKKNKLDQGDVTSEAGLPEKIDPSMPFYKSTFDNLKKEFATYFIQSNIGKTEEEVNQKTIIQVPNSGAATIPAAAPDFTAPTNRLRAITNLDARFLGKKGKSASGKDTYDVTDQFTGLNLFQNRSGRKKWGPVEVQYNPDAAGTGEGRIFYREKKGEPLKSMPVRDWNTLLEEKTGGTGYDTPKKKAY